MNENQVLIEALAKMLGKTMDDNTVQKDSRKSKVKIVLAEDGTRVREYENQMDPENPIGYVVVEEMEIRNTSMTWKDRKRRSALIKGKVDVLKEWLKDLKTNILPGKIVVQEYLESNVPQEIVDEFLPKEDNPNYDELYERSVKKNGNGEDAIPLTVNDERILRFSIYDEFDEYEDILIKHDNVDEVKANSRERRMRAVAAAQAEQKKLNEAAEKKAKAEAEAKEKAEAEEQGDLPG